LSKQFNEPEARMLVHRPVWQANFAPIPILPAGKKGRDRHGKGVGNEYTEYKNTEYKNTEYKNAEYKKTQRCSYLMS
jgi:hypothetical protein